MRRGAPEPFTVSGAGGMMIAPRMLSYGDLVMEEDSKAEQNIKLCISIPRLPKTPKKSWFVVLSHTSCLHRSTPMCVLNTYTRMHRIGTPLRAADGTADVLIDITVTHAHSLT